MGHRRSWRARAIQYEQWHFLINIINDINDQIDSVGFHGSQINMYVLNASLAVSFCLIPIINFNATKYRLYNLREQCASSAKKATAR